MVTVMMTNLSMPKQQNDYFFYFSWGFFYSAGYFAYSKLDSSTHLKEAGI